MTRIVLFEMLLVGLLCSRVLDALPHKAWVTGAALLWVAAEGSGKHYYDWSRAQFENARKNVSDRLTDPHCEAFVFLGGGSRGNYSLDAASASLSSGIPTVNGYSGNSPPDWPFWQAWKASSEQMEQWLGSHGKKGLKWCVVR